jgi:hypothetical protein
MRQQDKIISSAGLRTSSIIGVEWSGVGVEWSLRPTVSRPVRLGIGPPFGAHDQILNFLYSHIYLFRYVGRRL